MKLELLPDIEKPRERLIRYGVTNLSNEDLLSIILRTGTKNKNVKELSKEVLTKIKKIENLDELNIQDFVDIKGLGPVKAITVIAAIELGKRVTNKTIDDKLLISNTKVIHDYFSNLIANKKQEEILVILVDHRSRLINYQSMYKGTSNSVLVNPKDIYHYAIKERASGVIVMHNHPSGEITPSREDIEITNKLIDTGKFIGIKFLDHIITNGKDYFSFFDNGVQNEN